MSGNTDGFSGPSDIPVENNDSYALSGRIMLSTIVLLFFIVILAFILHLYARWYLLRSRRLRSNNRRNRRRTQLVFYVGTNTNSAAAMRGLDCRVIKSLPVFTYSAETHPDAALECAVCLSEFEESESGRILPKCKHSFHLECIDMWFHSHSTCPLCRTPVEASVPESENPGDLVLTINEPSGGDSGSNRGSDFCATCQHEDGQVDTSQKKLSIEVPRRNTQGFEGGESSGCNSGPSQPYKSPMSRMLSFKRMLSLSRDRRGSGSITISELDIERGEDATAQTQS